MPYIPMVKVGDIEYKIKDAEAQKQLGKVTQNLCKVIAGNLGTVSNVPVTNNYDGTMTVNGTSTDAGICYITDEIVLPAGTYIVGFLPAVSDLYIQVRDFTGGSDQGGLAQTHSHASFTLSAQTTVRTRLMTEAGKTYSNLLIRPILTKEGEFPQQWIPYFTANDVVSRNKLATGMVQKDETGITDLNDVLEAGYYFLSASYDYNNLPDIIRPHTSGALLLKVFAYAMDDDPRPFVVQELWVLSSYFSGMVFVRRNTNGTWQPWVKPSEMEYVAAEYFTDLNDAKLTGFYFLTSTVDYDNLPDELRPHTSGALTLRVYAMDKSFLQQEIYIYSNKFAGSVYQRRFANNTCFPWYKIADAQSLESMNRTQLESISPSSIPSQGENIGTNIRVMSYNVAHYNNDTATYLPNTKLFNLRKVIGKVNADFLLIQEGNKYIDGPGDGDPNPGTKTAENYIFHPAYPGVYGDQTCMIVSKRNMTTWGWLQYTTGRALRYSVWISGNIKLLLVSTHPVAGSTEEKISERKGQYDELFKWVKGQINLNVYGGGESVHVPEWTHCVIGMDANCEFPEDKTNLLGYAKNANFIAGNGGALGWFYTWYSVGMEEKYSLDCIFVSDNIIINNVESYGDWFERLYSDHVPVVADLTLL